MSKTINVKLKKTDTTREKLIKVTQYLLAKYGYEVATTRLIAKTAGVSLSAINFHFETKEKLVHAAVSDAAEQLEAVYSRMTEDMRAFLATEGAGPEKAWGYIEELITRTIHMTFNRRDISLINIGLVEHENGFPKSCQGIMSRVAIKYNENVLAGLITVAMKEKNHYQACVIARSISAVVMSYMEKPLLNREFKKISGEDMEDRDRMEKYLHTYFMQSIRAAVEHPEKEEQA
jgi:AcrR family transcriptional regulator